VTAHARHYHVGEEEVDVPPVVAQHGEGFDPIPRLQDPVAVPAQDLVGQLAHQRLVLDQQDRLRSAPSRRARRVLPREVGLGVVGGEVDGERAPRAGLAGDEHLAAALRHDAVDGREAEAGAVSRPLGREERLEDPLLDVAAHADARVPDGERDVAPGLELGPVPHAAAADLGVGRGDREDTPGRHRIARVHGEVHQDLLELAGVRPGVAQARRQRRPELDVLADDAAEHPVYSGHDSVEVDDPRLQQLPPAEREQLMGQLRRAAPRLPDLLDVFPAHVVRRELVQHHLAVAQDRAEQVVEVVRDAARQPAHRLHLERLAELLLGLAQGLLGAHPPAHVHVDRHEADGLAVRVVQRRAGDADLEAGPVLPGANGLAVGEAVAGHHLGAEAVEFLLPVVRDAREPTADGLLLRPPEDGFRGPVPADHFAAARQADDRERRRVDECLELIAGRADQLFGGPPLGHVTLRSPDGGQQAVFHHAQQVVDEEVLCARAVQLAGLELDGAIAAPDEGAEEVEAPRVGHVEGGGELAAEQLLRRPAGVHPEHRFVDLDEAHVPGAVRDLLLLRGRHRERRHDGRAPDSLRRPLDEEPVLLPAFPERLGRSGGLGDVFRHHQACFTAREPDRMARDPNQQQPAVLPPVPPGPRPHLQVVCQPRDMPEEQGAVLLGPDVENAHPAEFLPRVAVVFDRGGVDLEEGQRLGVVDPHRQRVVLEQRAVGVGRLLGRRLGHRRGPAHAGRPPASGSPSAWRTVRRRRSSEKGFSRKAVPGSISRRRAIELSLVPEM
jgi:hypothetical protein